MAQRVITIGALGQADDETDDTSADDSFDTSTDDTSADDSSDTSADDTSSSDGTSTDVTTSSAGDGSSLSLGNPVLTWGQVAMLAGVTVAGVFALTYLVTKGFPRWLTSRP